MNEPATKVWACDDETNRTISIVTDGNGRYAFELDVADAIDIPPNPPYTFQQLRRILDPEGLYDRLPADMLLFPCKLLAHIGLQQAIKDNEPIN